MNGGLGWRGYRIVDGISALLAVGAVAMLVWPVSTNVAPTIVRVPVVVADTSASSTARDAARIATVDSAYRALVQSNVLSASRREPTARFVAPGTEVPTPAFSVGESSMAMTTSDTDAGPKVVGIVSMGGTKKALLQLQPPPEPPRLMAAGEVFAGFRLVRIQEDRVVISSSSGTRTLRLSRVLSDSIEKMP